MRSTSSASSRPRGGRIDGSRRAASVLPAPGGPTNSRLCPPAAAISSARRGTAGRAGRPGREARPGRRSIARPRCRAAAARSSRAEHRQLRAAPGESPAPAGERRLAGVRGRHRDRLEAALGPPPRRSPAPPATGLIDPSSASSPASASGSSRCRRELAGGGEHRRGDRQVEPGAALRRSAGARFAVIRCCGNLNPELTSAARTRSRDSRTAASGSPTSEKPAAPARRRPRPAPPAPRRRAGRKCERREHPSKLGGDLHTWGAPSAPSQ